MLDWLKQNTSAARERLTNEVTKFKNREFMEAVVAGCAIVAAADGSISSEEKRKMVGFMESSDELKVFDMSAVIKAFKDTVGKFEFDQKVGEAEAMRSIAKVKGKGAEKVLVQVCCAIGAADGDFDDDEKAAVKRICGELDLDPGEFDL